MLEGTPTLRTPEETVELAPWDIAFFPTGPDGAHQIRNDSDATARVLMWSEVTKIAATVYPDSDKIGIWTGNDTDSMLVERSAKVDYYHGETGLADALEPRVRPQLAADLRARAPVDGRPRRR